MRSIYERRANQELVAEGYFVDYKIRPRICPRGYKVDYFGVFDLIAYKPGEAFVRWIAIKGVSGDRHKIREIAREFLLPPGNQKELWYVNDAGVWRKEIL